MYNGLILGFFIFTFGFVFRWIQEFTRRITEIPVWIQNKSRTNPRMNRRWIQGSILWYSSLRLVIFGCFWSLTLIFWFTVCLGALINYSCTCTFCTLKDWYTVINAIFSLYFLHILFDFLLFAFCVHTEVCTWDLYCRPTYCSLHYSNCTLLILCIIQVCILFKLTSPGWYSTVCTHTVWFTCLTP